MLNIFLPYFKQGDDLAGHLEHNDSQVQAVKNHSAQMMAVSEMLGEIAVILEKYPEESYEIIADTHFVGVSTENQELIDELVDAELAEVDEFCEECD